MLTPFAIITIISGYLWWCRFYRKEPIEIPREPSDRKVLLLELFPEVRAYYKDVTWGKVRSAHVKPELLEKQSVLAKSLLGSKGHTNYVSSAHYSMCENKDFWVFISPETFCSLIMIPKRKFKITSHIKY